MYIDKVSEAGHVLGQSQWLTTRNPFHQAIIAHTPLKTACEKVSTISSK